MAETVDSKASSVTVTEQETHSPATQQRLLLKLKKPKNDKKVKWDSKTVDNEHMDKKKSKCCCIYDKPKIFGESSSSESDSDDDGCPHNAYCTGHKKTTHHHDDSGGQGAAGPSNTSGQSNNS